MKKILVVEDEKALRNVLTDKLSAEGYEVISAKNGSDALEIVKSTSLDLVILDIVMPGISGVEVAKEIQKCEEIEIKPKIIVLSNKDDIETVSEVLATNTFIYLVKSDNSLEKIVSSVKEELG